ncbi:MAG: hypothetical protein QM523_01835 [Candidatus Pacebacteria bacterium]|nr:hypothetical protein [Candidatus Paceibacterota bacterium]
MKKILLMVLLVLTNLQVVGLAAEEQLNRPPRVKRAVIKLLHTKYPLWQVGTIDQYLSRECSLGRFNQRVPFKYAGQFYGSNGAAMLGGVKGSGLNLHDPLGQATPDHDYWFYRDRTSACVVYWAQVQPTEAPPSTATETPTAP